MDKFIYVVGMTEEEMTERVSEMIAYMRTDEYWIERGDSSPDYTEGSWLMKEYLKMTDNKLVERKDTLIVSYNKALQIHTFRRDLENRTKKRTITMTMMSGKEFEISLERITTYADLASAVFKELTPKKGTIISIVDGGRVLSSFNPRLIITDDTALSVVLSEGRK